jgi:hypothetical protein
VWYRFRGKAGVESRRVRCTGTGTNSAELMGTPLWGKRRALALLQFRDGKIAQHWWVWDTLGMLQRLGDGATVGRNGKTGPAMAPLAASVMLTLRHP